MGQENSTIKEIEEMAFAYFKKDEIGHLDMSEPIRRGHAQIIFADKEKGVCLIEKNSGGYFLSAQDEACGKQMLDQIEECELICLHQEFLYEMARKKFHFSEQLQVRQYGYLGELIPETKGDLTIRPIQEEDLSIVLNNYHIYSMEELEWLKNQEYLFGGYLGSKLVGFVGIHPEGSLGLLKVLDNHLRKGYGRVLEVFITNHVIKKGWIPFGQVAKGNQASIALQSSLGVTPSDNWIYWMFGS